MQYSISALAKKTGLSIHTLRFYEKEGILRHVERSASGRRIYGEESLGCIIGILCLKQAGLSLPQIKEFFDWTLEGSDTLPDRLALFESARQNLIEQREILERSISFVDTAISYSKSAIEAAKQGNCPEEAYPFLTLKGMTNFPYIEKKNERLEPFLPEIDELFAHAEDKPQH